LHYLLPLEDEDAAPLPVDAWRLFTPCGDAEGEDCPLLDQAGGLGDNLERQFDTLLAMIRKLAATGKNWKELIRDEKALHDLGTVRIALPTGQVVDERIWQFKQGQVRLLWCYGGGKKVLLLTHLAVKKSQKTPKADIEAARRAMQDYVSAREGGQLRIVGDEDERTLHQLFAQEAGKPRVPETGKTGRGRR
jgi:phage-related protein